MLFNSLQFAVFFVVVYSLYLILNHKWQNRMLLVASCIFYGTWNWKFLFLMFTSISVDYFCALRIDSTNDNKIRKRFVTLSILVNLSILGFFKYFNFFVHNFQSLFSFFGLSVPVHLLNIILPLGISFYSFEAMSYVIDVYRRVMVPIKRYRDYALFVTYFPHLIAGPIMRAKDLMPQICFPRKLTLGKVYEGIYLISWGMFQKVVVADNLAWVVNPVFASHGPYDGLQVLFALYAFALQIYCDFAGYSNIARGLGKCMGFEIMVNFNLPYFATNPREFWQRWHISLSTWLRDYLYVPLGGNRQGEWMTYRNLAITMFLGGLWHGASWTFIIWGIYQGALLIIYRMLTPLLQKIPTLNGLPGQIWHFVRIIFFFHLVCFGWLLFRAESLGQIGQMTQALFHIHIMTLYGLSIGIKSIIVFAWFLLIMDIVQFVKNDLLIIFKWHWAWEGASYFMMVFLILVMGAGGAKQFIYFQF
jgi:alginate O-acetyltransferase complex protein AlgI